MSNLNSAMVDAINALAAKYKEFGYAPSGGYGYTIYYKHGIESRTEIMSVNYSYYQGLRILVMQPYQHIADSATISNNVKDTIETKFLAIARTLGGATTYAEFKLTEEMQWHAINKLIDLVSTKF